MNENKIESENEQAGGSDEHGVATGVGALGGGATGAAIGTVVGGPIGTVVGAVIGAMAGGAGGYAVGEAIDPAAEDAYWSENHPKQPFAKRGSYEEFQPAYRTGFEGYNRFAGEQKSYEEIEPDLEREYEASEPDLPWDQARDATRAAWGRAERGEAVTVPITEEQVKVGKREVEQGSVNIRKEVHTETVNTPIDLQREELVVERTDTSGETVPGDAFQEGEMRIPLMREEAVVQKEAKVMGEVRVSKRQNTERQNISETVRKEDVKVDRSDEEAKGC